MRPATALRRRKEIKVNVSLPRKVFEDFMSPLTPEDAEGLERDPATGWLLPTKTTATLRKFRYSIKRGSVSDRLFHLEDMDPPPKPSSRPTAQRAQIGEDGVYEVESILGKRHVCSRLATPSPCSESLLSGAAVVGFCWLLRAAASFCELL